MKKISIRRRQTVRFWNKQLILFALKNKSRAMILKIETVDDYIEAMNQIEKRLQKVTKNGGFDALTETEADELARLSLLVEVYEDCIPIMENRSKSLAFTLRIEMMNRLLKQKDVAQLLDISESDVADILSEKRQIDTHLAEKIYKSLNIKADFSLQTA